MAGARRAWQPGAADGLPCRRLKPMLRRPSPLLAATVALASIALAPRPAAAQCCPPVPVSRASWSSTAGYQAMPLWVGATDDGWVHAVHRASWVAHLYTSSDRGHTFGFPDTEVTEGAVTDGFALAFDGTLLAAYSQGGELRVRRSTDRAASWSPPLALGPMQAGGVFPMPPLVQFSLATGGLTALLAVTAQGAEQDHVVLVSPDFGASWSPPLAVRSSGGWLARVAVTETTVVLAYEEGGVLLTRRSADAGRSWSAPVRAGSLPLRERWHRLVATGPQRFALVHGVDPGATWSEVRVAVSSDDGVTWDPADESGIGTSDFLVSEPPWAIATPSGGLAVGGWHDVPLSPGVASNFSSSGGLPGTWLPSPIHYAPAGRAQHDHQVAVQADDTVVVVHDDYRHEGTADCPPGRECESIFMSRACPGAGAWEETRLDEDEAPHPTHSETPALATTSDGRVHVIWMNLPDVALGAAQLRTMTTRPVDDAALTLTLTPAPDCQSATQELALDPGLLATCPTAAIQWYLNDVAIPAANAPTLLLDPADIDGTSRWHATFACGTGCESRTRSVTPQPFRPADPPVVLRTDVPAGTCAPPRVVLEAVPLPTAECPLAAYQWYRDGGAIPGARAATLVVSTESFPAGTASYHCEARCFPPRACGPSVWPPETVMLDTFSPGAPGLLRTELPASGCEPARTLLELVALPLAECPSSTVQWFRDGAPIAGATGPTLTVSPRAFAPGTYGFHARQTCSPATACSEDTAVESVAVLPSTVPLPRDVGAALRVGPHGDPHAPAVTARLDWSRDEGLPRTDEHYHVLRGETPTRLALVPGLEPLAALALDESTPASGLRPHAWFYSVLAANPCEDLSFD